MPASLHAQEDGRQRLNALSSESRANIAILADAFRDHRDFHASMVVTDFENAIFPGDHRSGDASTPWPSYFENAIFPGDRRSEDASTPWPSSADFPYQAQEAESWYIRQVGQTFDGRHLNSSDEVLIYYLAGCDSRERAPLSEALFPDLEVYHDDFAAWEVELAQMLVLSEYVEDAFDVSRVDLSLVDQIIEEDRHVSGNGCLSPSAIVRFNQAINQPFAEHSDERDIAGALAFRRFRGENIRPSLFSGIEPVATPLPAQSTPAPNQVFYYFFNLPDGMESAKVVRGFVALQCMEREASVQFENCPVLLAQSIPIRENVPIPIHSIKRHWFVGRIGHRWVAGRFEISRQRAQVGPIPPLPPGATPASQGYDVIELFPDE